jgi:hypothetical protein
MRQTILPTDPSAVVTAIDSIGNWPFWITLPLNLPKD